MSLDIIRSRIVLPIAATAAHAVNEYGDFTIFAAVQPSGFICTEDVRIGRNCLGDSWHHLDKLHTPSVHDDDGWRNAYMKAGALTPMARLRIAVTREEYEERIAPHIDVSEEGSWFRAELLDEPWDFIWVSW